MKENFIKELKELLTKYEIVEDMKYEDNGFDEIVKISKCGTSRLVYVTRDSKLQMLKDIISQGGLD